MTVNVYIGDISRLQKDENRLSEIFNELSVYRQEKALKLKTNSGRALSLGAGYLLKLALAKFKIKENNAEYGFSENGKPYLLGYPEIRFNLSHSHERVMCVCAKGDIELGCDVEMVRNERLKVAKRFFTEYENRLLDECATDKDRDALFFELWTLKESYIKCTGEGLARSMDSFEFSRYRGRYRMKYVRNNNISETVSFDEKSDFNRFKFKIFDANMLNTISAQSADNSEFIDYKYALCYKTGYRYMLKNSDFKINPVTL